VTARYAQRKPISIEVEIRQMRADLMEHTRDGAADAIVEPLRRVDVHWATGIFTSLMVDCVMRRKPGANRDEDPPFVTHQMRGDFDSLWGNPVGLGLG
jgi:hypothetical protein